MPQGYKCNRCGTFVEQDSEFTEANNLDPHTSRPVEEVIVHPPTDDDDAFAVNEYTLCEDCRGKLAEWVEDGDPTSFLDTFNSVELSFSPTPSKPYRPFINIPGVGKRKAKALYDAGFRTKKDLKKASQSDLADVEGISVPLAARIKADVGDYKSASDVVEEIEAIVGEYEGDA